MTRKRRITRPKSARPSLTGSFSVDHSLDIVDGFSEFMITVSSLVAELAYSLADYMSPDAPRIRSTRHLWEADDPRR